jgi:hypothetical protein
MNVIARDSPQISHQEGGRTGPELTGPAQDAAC